MTPGFRPHLSGNGLSPMESLEDVIPKARSLLPDLKLHTLNSLFSNLSFLHTSRTEDISSVHSHIDTIASCIPDLDITASVEDGG